MSAVIMSAVIMIEVLSVAQTLNIMMQIMQNQ